MKYNFFINFCVGLLLMMVSGIHIAYGIFDLDIKTMHTQLITKSSWYVGVILAGFAAHFLIEKWEKKSFYVSFNFFLYVILIN